MDTTSVELIAGAVLPILISFLKKLHYPDTLNAVIALAVYAVFGVIGVVVSGQTIDVNNLVPTIAIVTASGTVAYQLFWKNWGDPQIQAKVSPTPAASTDVPAPTPSI